MRLDRPDVRLLLLARIVDGTVLLLAPGLVTDAVSGRRTGSTTRLVARVLGARQVAEAAASVRLRTRGWVLARAVVDAVHAATMLGLASARPASRRLALTSAALASGFAAAGLAEARHLDR